MILFKLFWAPTHPKPDLFLGSETPTPYQRVIRLPPGPPTFIRQYSSFLLREPVIAIASVLVLVSAVAALSRGRSYRRTAWDSDARITYVALRSGLIG